MVHLNDWENRFSAQWKKSLMLLFCDTDVWIQCAELLINCSETKSTFSSCFNLILVQLNWIFLSSVLLSAVYVGLLFHWHLIVCKICKVMHQQLETESLELIFHILSYMPKCDFSLLPLSLSFRINKLSRSCNKQKPKQVCSHLLSPLKWKVLCPNHHQYWLAGHQDGHIYTLSSCQGLPPSDPG